MRDPWLKKLGGALLALSAVAAAGCLAFSLSRQSGIHKLQGEAGHQLAMLRTTLLAPIDKYSYLPEIIAHHPDVIDALQHEHDPQRVRQANLLLESMNRIAGSAVIYALDAQGLTIASSNWQNPQSFVGDNYAFRPYFHDAVRNGSGRFFGIGTTSMMPGYYVSHVARKGDTVLGVTVVKVDLANRETQWTLNNTRNEVVVTDKNGIIFLSSRAEWKYRPMMQALSAQTLERLKRTRQYGAALKEPLSLETLSHLGQDQRLISILRNTADGNGQEEARYLMKSGAFAGSDWTVHVLAPMADVDTQAVRAAIVSAGTLAFIFLAVMYVGQVGNRIKEREKSRLDLERAHEALEQQHSELQKLTEELRLKSITDPLTGVYNRRFFFETVGKLVSTANRHQFDLAIVIIDVDHFKRINDRYGHPAGDKVLQVLTGICKQALREADVFARFGGEEFIMAMPNSDRNAAYAATERLRVRVMNQPIEFNGEVLRITVSGGVSQYQPQETSIEDTLKRADDALYVAKNHGRNRVVMH